MRTGRLVASLACLAPALVGGCYSYSSYPMERPSPGMVAEVTLNDRGRVAMENHLGPEILTAEGMVSEMTDSSFVLRVERVVGIDRRPMRWNREPVFFQLEHIRFVRERRFSRGRTVLLAGTVTASLFAFAAGTAIIGFGGDRPGPGGGTDPSDQ